MVATLASLHHDLGHLSAFHLERVVAIDRAHTGHSRRHFFEKRFAAAQAHPDEFIMLGVMRGGSLRGFVIARVLRGEFGREEDVAVLDAVGVETESQDRGIGHSLMDELVATLRRKGVRALHSQAKWVNHELLRFFEASGFALAPRFILERSVAEGLREEIEEP
jgi:ribosomal protein S18 acetylase RimI-like enzyme